MNRDDIKKAIIHQILVHQTVNWKIDEKLRACHGKSIDGAIRLPL
jgi:hypothetical protein